MSATEPTIIREKDLGAVAVRARGLFTQQVEAALGARGVAHVALAGGTTPERMYSLTRLESWQGVELWFGDERCVGPEDPQSNYRMVADELLPHAPGALVHRIEGERGAEAAARAYDDLVRSRVAGDGASVPVFDLILLGIGEDGHTASLFPENAALDAQGVAVVPVHDSPKPPPDRVSLSLEVLRAARACVLLASGSGKATALAGALAEPSRLVPSSLLERERLTVVADAAALADVDAAAP
jgi:6-phosphogluconolactonase